MSLKRSAYGSTQIELPRRRDHRKIKLTMGAVSVAAEPSKQETAVAMED
jgi:hypothetical protein